MTCTGDAIFQATGKEAAMEVEKPKETSGDEVYWCISDGYLWYKWY